MTPEQRLISRTWRRIWWQTSAVVAVAVLAVAGAAAGLVLRSQHDAARQALSRALDHALTTTGDPAVTAAPAGIWVYRWEAGNLAHTPGAPGRPIDDAGLARSAGPAVATPGRGSTAGPHEVQHADREYLVDSARAGAVTVQVALDLTAQEDEQHRLYFALGIAGALGLALAAAAGALIARRAIQPLGVAIERQRRFVADASHELRTPITQLHTRAQILSRSLHRLAGLEGAAGDARQLVRGTRVMADIVEEMLLSAQLRSEPAQFGSVDLAAVAMDVVEAYRDQAAERDTSLELSSGTGPYVVRGVPGALRRVLSALIDNALGHVSPGGHVRVELERGAVEVSCSVRDDGTGFDPADAERIFERFARGSDGAGRRFGLGLALAREAVQAHGGTVDATAEPGRGASFTVRLPATAIDDATPRQARAQGGLRHG